ncbi:MAG TPA: CapA family protein [Acidimicrobiales bacterium]|nr:CapA family protein [Acidimicrobiales bacterium]
MLLLLALVAAGLVLSAGGGRAPRRVASPGSKAPRAAKPIGVRRLDPDWDGDGRPVTMVFGGDVNFPDGSVLGDRLADDASTALGPGASALLAGANLSMVNLETALTDGTCPSPQPKQYVFYAPSSAITALQGADVTLVTEANNHGEDCGEPGLQMSISARDSAPYPIIGIGQNATEAYTPYEATIDGQHIVIIAATQVIDADLQTDWTATEAQAGLASAYDVDDLVQAVEAARQEADTVVVFVHWGIELQDHPDPKQEPLAEVLVKAGADIVVGSHAHVLLGGGYLGSAYVDYGLGNFAFYNDPSPTDVSGTLVITATGRHIDDVTWRPALIEDELPVPLTGDEATQAVAAWNNLRGLTDLSADPGAPIASPSTESQPPPAAVAQQLSLDS